MDKPKAVIKGLGEILVYCHDQYNKCDGAGQQKLSSINQTAKDAIELLKAQQPRVLNLNEIHRGMVVWLEQYKVPEMLLVIGGSSAGGAHCFITENDLSIAPLDEEYNKRWRAWTTEPFAGQREAVQWDD